jgi:hypothetical protein
MPEINEPRTLARPAIIVFRCKQCGDEHYCQASIRLKDDEVSTARTYNMFQEGGLATECISGFDSAKWLVHRKINLEEEEV